MSVDIPELFIIFYSLTDSYVENGNDHAQEVEKPTFVGILQAIILMSVSRFELNSLFLHLLVLVPGTHYTPLPFCTPQFFIETS